MKPSVPLRIGKIRYLNCLPFYFGLEERFREEGLEASFFDSHPVAINKAMQDGAIDAAPVSSLEYLQHQEDYYLIPDSGIGARLFARSVLLLSKKKIEDLNHSVIALSEESLSSSGLLRILLNQKYGFSNIYERTAQDPEGMLQQYPAALLIGDDALFCQPKEMIYKYDLAALWQEWTGKPFVFAVWAVRRDFAEQDAARSLSLARILKENLLKNLADPESLLKQALGVAREEKRFCQLLGYLTNLQYIFDQEMREGLRRYFELAHEEGLAPAPRALRNLP